MPPHHIFNMYPSMRKSSVIIEEVDIDDKAYKSTDMEEPLVDTNINKSNLSTNLSSNLSSNVSSNVSGNLNDVD